MYDKKNAYDQDEGQNQQGAVEEKLFRQDPDDLIGVRIKDPVGFAREKYLVEGHEQSVKGNRTPDSQQDKQQNVEDSRVEERTLTAKTVNPDPAQPVKQQKQHDHGQRDGQHGKIQVEESKTVFKMSFPRRRPGQRAGAKRLSF